jgi:kynurenine formamidase
MSPNLPLARLLFFGTCLTLVLHREAPAGQTAAAGNEMGMARELGTATWGRCAEQLGNPRARMYELSYVRSATMPLSPFAGPYAPKHLPTSGLPGSSQVFNMDVMNDNANPAQQGTQMDALGHFAYLDKPWDGTGSTPVERAHYYGGFTQREVKPTPDSPLLKLGMEKAPPIVTTAILLDARKHVGRGKAMGPGEVVTPQHIEGMLQAQGLQGRGILPGDVVYVYTGWSEHYQDPDVAKLYYPQAPGLSLDAAKYFGEKRVVAVGLDTPFLDPVNEGQLAGQAAPPAGVPPDLAFAIHHQLITQAGIHLIENVKLDELARDQISTSCTIVLPLREKGASGSAVRPIAVGAPGR